MSELPTDPQLAVQHGRSSSTGPWVLLAVVAAVACIYLALFRPNHRATGANPAVGRHLPDLQLQPLTGDSSPVTLADLSGEMVLVNFWGTWCPPCKEEFPHLVTLAEKLKNRPGFRFLSVSCGMEADLELDELRKETRAYLQQLHSTIPTYADQAAYTRRNLALVLGGEGFAYPTTIVLDQSGVIRGVWTGYEEGVTDDIEHVIGVLLEQPPG